MLVKFTREDTGEIALVNPRWVIHADESRDRKYTRLWIFSTGGDWWIPVWGTLDEVADKLAAGR